VQNSKLETRVKTDWEKSIKVAKVRIGLQSSKRRRRRLRRRGGRRRRKRRRRAGHILRMGDRSGVYRVLVG
jgi:hypothetical protein